MSYDQLTRCRSRELILLETKTVIALGCIVRVLPRVTVRVVSCAGTQEPGVQTQHTNIFVKDPPDQFPFIYNRSQMLTYKRMIYSSLYDMQC